MLLAQFFWAQAAASCSDKHDQPCQVGWQVICCSQYACSEPQLCMVHFMTLPRLRHQGHEVPIVLAKHMLNYILASTGTPQQQMVSWQRSANAAGQFDRIESDAVVQISCRDVLSYQAHQQGWEAHAHPISWACLLNNHHVRRCGCEPDKPNLPLPPPPKKLCPQAEHERNRFSVAGAMRAAKKHTFRTSVIWLSDLLSGTSFTSSSGCAHTLLEHPTSHLMAVQTNLSSY